MIADCETAYPRERAGRFDMAGRDRSNRTPEEKAAAIRENVIRSTLRQMAREKAEASAFGFTRGPRIETLPEAHPLHRASVIAKAGANAGFTLGHMLTQWSVQCSEGRTIPSEHGLNARDVNDELTRAKRALKMLVEELRGAHAIVLAEHLRDVPPAETSPSVDSLVQLQSGGLG